MFAIFVHFSGLRAVFSEPWHCWGDHGNEQDWDFGPCSHPPWTHWPEDRVSPPWFRDEAPHLPGNPSIRLGSVSKTKAGVALTWKDVNILLFVVSGILSVHVFAIKRIPSAFDIAIQDTVDDAGKRSSTPYSTKSLIAVVHGDDVYTSLESWLAIPLC